MEIHPVKIRSELQEFVELPYQLYHDDPVWVPPLRSEQWNQFNPVRNPMLDHCEYTLFLLKNNGKVIGRISAFIDRLAVEHWKEPIGLFGSFECVNDPNASKLLFEATRDWLQSKGMKVMRGPWSFASQEWGLVVEGYKPSPVIMAPYNSPYYNDLLIAFGLKKAKDLMVYYIDAHENYQIPKEMLEFSNRVAERYGVRVRPIDMSRLEEEVVTIVKLSNRAIADNWGYYPVTDAEGRIMAHDMKDIVNPKAILIAELNDGTPIGFAMSLPDVNVILKGLNGRLLPFGWINLLWGLPRLKQYRMWALGVIPEFHGKAIDTLLYRGTYDALYNKDLRLEINYVLEDNGRMNNALLRMNVKPLRRYRVYEKLI